MGFSLCGMFEIENKNLNSIYNHSFNIFSNKIQFNSPAKCPNRGDLLNTQFMKTLSIAGSFLRF